MELLDLYDSQRQRAVPVAYYPAPAPRALVLLSVGFGGVRTNYRYLGEAWQALGMSVAVVEHVGSNLEVLRSLKAPGSRIADLHREVLRRVRDPEECHLRPGDLEFVSDQLGPHNQLVLAGHSFGAFTCLAARGVGVTLAGRQTRRPGLRPRAQVLMSCSPPDTVLDPGDLDHLVEPILIVTGTHDDGPGPDLTPLSRQQIYTFLPPGDRYLAVLDGADHMSFAAVGLDQAIHTERTARLTGDFLTQVLEGHRFGCPAQEGVVWTFDHL